MSTWTVYTEPVSFQCWFVSSVMVPYVALFLWQEESRKMSIGDLMKPGLKRARERGQQSFLCLKYLMSVSALLKY